MFFAIFSWWPADELLGEQGSCELLSLRDVVKRRCRRANERSYRQDM